MSKPRMTFVLGRTLPRLAPLAASMALAACSFVPTYERPVAPDLIIEGGTGSVGDAAMMVVELLRQRGIVW